MKNKNDVSTMLKEAGILFCITLLAGLLLGFVYELTKEPRRIQQEKAVQEACIAVFPKAAEQGIELQFEDTGYVPDEALAAELAENNVKIGTVFAAYHSGALYGYVVESVSTKGYGGSIVLYVGVGIDGTVNGVSITEISETAGLGMEAPNVLTPQFAGKKVESFVFTKTGAAAENEVDAISGATITTRAVTNAANGGLKTALILLGGGAVNE
ncbi:MAG: FMN-binding protein [Butyrivibrio sp.]|nr:FMN-binding protein [Acetatifactor muris]MCM1560502.1 FMN-binding protein [Butyrivibrio sp.]